MSEVRKIWRIDENGNKVLVLIETDASVVAFNNANSGIAANNVEGAIKEVKQLAAEGGGAVKSVNSKTPNTSGNVDINYGDVGAEQAGAITEHNNSASAHGTIITPISNSISSIQSKLVEVEGIAKGKSQAYSFDTKVAMTAELETAPSTKYKIGDNLLIKQKKTPDYWISAIKSTQSGAYGFYEISELETEQIDLTDYQKITDNSLQTTAKTIPTAINEVKQKTDTNAGNIATNTTNIATAQGAANAAQSRADNAHTRIDAIVTSGSSTVKKAEHSTTTDKLKTPISFSVSGDVTGTVTNKDLSGSVSIPTTLKASGVVAGTYSALQVNTKGIATAGGQMLEWGADNAQTPTESLVDGGLFFEKKGEIGNDLPEYLPQGGTNGQILERDSTQPSGAKWVDNNSVKESAFVLTGTTLTITI